MAASEREAREGGSDVVASQLDEITHAEFRLLYQDCAEAIRFARERQWRLVGATLLIFVAVMALAEFVAIDPLIAKGLVLASLLVSAGAIYILIIYQVWQSSEIGRMNAVSARFSNVFSGLGGPGARRDMRMHGHIILILMILGIVLGNAVTVLFLSRLYI